MMDDPLYRDPALAQFYDAANGWGADFDYCMALAAGAASVLDLGCGTGELAAALRPNRRVTGVDPAAAMLAIARQRPGGRDVTWVEADARSVRLSERFDLVLLTGHAFQVFLTSDDQRAALSTIAAHLAPNGRFIFDSRNPALRTWENRNRHNTRHRLEHPQLGTIEAWNEPSYDDDTNVLTYENGYRVLATGRTFSASAQIRYTPQEELAEMIEAAGLVVERWLGDWDGRPYHRTAREVIPIGRLARERPVMRTGRGTEELASAGPRSRAVSKLGGAGQPRPSRHSCA
jgi:SAM-dependent methyltransferase